MLRIPPVTLLLRYFTIGGLERVVSSLANCFVDRGVDTQIIVMSTGKRNPLITELDPRIELLLLSGSPAHKLSSLRRMTAGRLVHIHFGDGRIHPLVRAALMGRKVIVTYHSVYSHKRTWIANRVDQLVASRAAAIVAVSNAVKDFCVGDVCIPEERVRVIRNGVRAVPMRPPSMAYKDGPILLASVAGLYPHKNQTALLDGLAKVKERNLNVRLSLIGDGPTMADLYQHCKTLRLCSEVEWYGAIWRRDVVQQLVGSAHGYISASRFEGMPISVLEGMIQGLPMILSDIPSHREVAGDAALYFSLDNPESMVEQISHFATTEETRARMAERSLERAKRFDLSECVARYIELYCEVGN